MPKASNVLVLFKMDDEKKQRLEAINPDAQYTYTEIGNVTPEMIKSAEVILGSLDPEQVEGMPHLKWQQLWSAGTDNFQKNGKFPENAILTNATGGYGLTISEHLMCSLLIIKRKFKLYFKNQQEGKWHPEGDITSIYGSRVLIIGMGNIGSEFAKRVKAFGGYVIGVRRSEQPKPDFVDEVYTTDKIDELLPTADVVALSVPDTGDTQKLMSAQRIKLLKKGSIFMNVGRGSAVDTEALVEALESGQIYGAALDVTDPEPLPADHKLWKMDNVVITPHISGTHNLPETYRRILEIAIANYEAFTNDKPMRNVVDFKRGY